MVGTGDAKLVLGRGAALTSASMPATFAALLPIELANIMADDPTATKAKAREKGKKGKKGGAANATAERDL